MLFLVGTELQILVIDPLKLSVLPVGGLGHRTGRGTFILIGIAEEFSGLALGGRISFLRVAELFIFYSK